MNDSPGRTRAERPPGLRALPRERAERFAASDLLPRLLPAAGAAASTAAGWAASVAAGAEGPASAAAEGGSLELEASDESEALEELEELGLTARLGEDFGDLPDAAEFPLFPLPEELPPEAGADGAEGAGASAC